MYGILIVIAILSIWKQNQNRQLEYVMLAIILLGVHGYREMTVYALSCLHSFWKPSIGISSDFPNERALTTVVVYGMFVFLFVHRVKNVYIQMVIPVLSIVLITFLAIMTVALTSVLPSDLIGGYVYGAAWLCLHVFVLEMLRILINRQDI